jgi:hypothetical protein
MMTDPRLWLGHYHVPHRTRWQRIWILIRNRGRKPAVCTWLDEDEPPVEGWAVAYRDA